MSKEAPRRLDEGFGFTESEALFYRISHERFQELFADEQTAIHKIEVSYNNYGEFLFVTASRDTPQGRQPVTFYGQGYHEHRERWITQEWYWYRANAHPSGMKQVLEKEDAQERLQQRLEDIAPYIQDVQQSQRARLYEMLADLTDEDGAIAEMEDLPDGLFDDPV
jgi:hypothetical protein